VFHLLIKAERLWDTRFFLVSSLTKAQSSLHWSGSKRLLGPVTRLVSKLSREDRTIGSWVSGINLSWVLSKEVLGHEIESFLSDSKEDGRDKCWRKQGMNQSLPCGTRR